MLDNVTDRKTRSAPPKIAATCDRGEERRTETVRPRAGRGNKRHPAERSQTADWKSATATAPQPRRAVQWSAILLVKRDFAPHRPRTSRGLDRMGNRPARSQRSLAPQPRVMSCLATGCCDRRRNHSVYRRNKLAGLPLPANRPAIHPANRCQPRPHRPPKNRRRRRRLPRQRWPPCDCKLRANRPRG